MSNLKTCGCSDVNCTHFVMKTPTGWLHVADVVTGISLIGINVQQDKLAA
jgi:hypothetical protein